MMPIHVMMDDVVYRVKCHARFYDGDIGELLFAA
jgi:hypothetical protein